VNSVQSLSLPGALDVEEDRIEDGRNSTVSDGRNSGVDRYEEDPRPTFRDRDFPPLTTAVRAFENPGAPQAKLEERLNMLESKLDQYAAEARDGRRAMDAALEALLGRMNGAGKSSVVELAKPSSSQDDVRVVSVDAPDGSNRE